LWLIISCHELHELTLIESPSSIQYQSKNTNKVYKFFHVTNQLNLCHQRANKNNLEKQDAFLTFF